MIDVPQLVEATEISADYWNCYEGVRLRLASGRADKALERLRETSIPRYEDRYPSLQYKNVVTEKNEARVARLDQLAETTKELVVLPAAEFIAGLRATMTEAYTLIYGNGDFNPGF